MPYHLGVERSNVYSDRNPVFFNWMMSVFSNCIELEESNDFARSRTVYLEQPKWINNKHVRSLIYVSSYTGIPQNHTKVTWETVHEVVKSYGAPKRVREAVRVLEEINYLIVERCGNSIRDIGYNDTGIDGVYINENEDLSLAFVIRGYTTWISLVTSPVKSTH